MIKQNKMKTHNPHTEPHFVLSECCNAKTTTIPACFGDPSFTICNNCNKGAKTILRPVYEKIGKGHYREIKYDLTISTIPKEARVRKIAENAIEVDTKAVH